MASPENSTTNGTAAALPALATSASDFLAHAYDYIIIGGGTAGLVLAARLTEDPSIRVGVLEAGANRLNDALVDTPALFPQMLGNPSYEWNMKTAGNHNRTHHLPRGKLLGGSSGINYMLYVRGSARDYDDWATLTSDPSWSAAALAPYVRKHQALQAIPDTIANRVAMRTQPAYHGTSGPIHTSFNDTRLELEDAWLLAAEEACGVTAKVADAWSGDHYGFYNGMGSVYGQGRLKGRRCYAARGYFEENAGRENLKVLCDASVARILLEEGSAVGVEFIHAGETYSAKAEKEVLLCGGAIHSPQILELSGIGDPEVLKKAGVEVKVELPSVGENLQDHVIGGCAYQLAPGEVSMDSLFHPDAFAEAQKAFVENGSGPLTCVLSGQGFVSYKQLAPKEEFEKTIASIRKTQEISNEFQKRQLELVIQHLEDDRSANLQYVMCPASPVFEEEAVADQSKMWPPGDPNSPGFASACCLQYPVSRGSVHITSADVTHPPSIDPAYLRHPADVAVLGTGVKFADRMVKVPVLAARVGARTFPAPEIDMDDQKAAEEAVRDWIIGEYHVAGSCAMGDTVDSRLRVKGVSRLRVVDASVFPNHVSGNIQSSVYTLAERAADIIKEDNGHTAAGKLA
ncbi:Major facilitator superfamily [Macrophomina phaseolina MS6]|uniref:Major facilitator superfamily n=1 Tax=Macrophomina phaseolina (strain MS6) TaxID=1126212 RepID=K2SYL0_MACPH|nr:Major facilitator superfamily [Macrophomina phaseolina MS6]